MENDGMGHLQLNTCSILTNWQPIKCVLLFTYNVGYMLQVNPVNRPDIKEVLTGLEAIAIAMDVDLKGKVVSYKVNPVLVDILIIQGTTH